MLLKGELMLPKTTKVTGTQTIGFFMIQLKVVTTDLGKLMYIGLPRFLQILLTSVLRKAYPLQEIMGGYSTIGLLEVF